VAAALTDRAIGGRIDGDLEAAWAVDPTATGDAGLDRVLAQLVAEPARLPARAWIVRLSKQALCWPPGPRSAPTARWRCAR
jgi:hypothetical protein